MGKLVVGLRIDDDSHISQLSEKITPALPPGQEETKKKGWSQFWR